MGSRAGTGLVAVATNPAIDRVARIKGPASGIVRASELLETPGGKAIHAACVATELGADTAVITPAGGSSGDRLLELLASEPLEVHHVPVTGSTRGTYTLVGARCDDLVEVHEPAGSLTRAECGRLVSTLSELANLPRVVAICGSLPPGAPSDLHARLTATARELGAFTILDCSTSAALTAGLAAGPDLVAPNLAEAGELLGVELDSGLGDPELAAIVDAIRERGAAAVWLSLGSEGSVLSMAGGSFRLNAPAPGRIVNTVGCGDALVGGFAAGLIMGQDLMSAAALGTAAAGQKLAHLHPGRVDRAAVEALVPVVDRAPLEPQVAVR
jgi:1-phosphofructokinase family hexose kinase